MSRHGRFIVSALAVFAIAATLPALGLADQTGGSAPGTTTRKFATPRPTPTPRLPKPGAPHYSTDPRSCTKAGGSGDFCAQLKTGKYIAIYWPWSCTGSNCALGGFHVWLASSHKAITATPVRVVITNTPHTGTCYYVTAYTSPIGHLAESRPSKHICVHATSKTVTIKPNRTRGYTIQYWVLYSDDNPQVKHYPATTGRSDLIVGGIFAGTNQSQVNNWQRAAYAFDLSSLGGNSVFGGSFEYTYSAKYDPKQNCADLHRAPNGWQTANWIAATDSPFHIPYLSGSVLSWHIDDLIKDQDHSKPLALFLQEVYGVGPAEYIKSSVMSFSQSCQDSIVNPRLVVRVGITV